MRWDFGPVAAPHRGDSLSASHDSRPPRETHIENGLNLLYPSYANSCANTSLWVGTAMTKCPIHQGRTKGNGLTIFDAVEAVERHRGLSNEPSFDSRPRVGERIHPHPSTVRCLGSLSMCCTCLALLSYRRKAGEADCNVCFASRRCFGTYSVVREVAQCPRSRSHLPQQPHRIAAMNCAFNFALTAGSTLSVCPKSIVRRTPALN